MIARLFGGVVVCLWAIGVSAEVTPGGVLGHLLKPVDTNSLIGHHLYDVTWGNGQFVAVGQSGFDETEVLLSPDGVTWEQVSLGKTSRPLGVSRDGAGVLYGVVWSGSTFVAVGERILTSPEGKSWTVTESTSSCEFSRVAIHDSVMVAVGSVRGHGCLATSSDGRAWIDKTPALGSESVILTDVKWNGATFIVVGVANIGRLGLDSVVFSSSDGEQWIRDLGPADFLVDLTWGHNLWVAVGGASHQGVVFTSSDAKGWTEQTLQRAEPLRAILWTGAKFISVGVGGAIFTSADGTSWTSRQSGVVQDLLSVAWNGSLAVAVGEGVIIVSPDGEQWRLPHQFS